MRILFNLNYTYLSIACTWCVYMFGCRLFHSFYCSVSQWQFTSNSVDVLDFVYSLKRCHTVMFDHQFKYNILAMYSFKILSIDLNSEYFPLIDMIIITPDYSNEITIFCHLNLMRILKRNYSFDSQKMNQRTNLCTQFLLGFISLTKNVTLKTFDSSNNFSFNRICWLQ